MSCILNEIEQWCIELCVPLLCSDDAEDLNVDSGLKAGGGHAKDKDKSILVDIIGHGAEDLKVDSGLKAGVDHQTLRLARTSPPKTCPTSTGPGMTTTIPSTKTSSSDPSTLLGSEGKDDLPLVVNSERQSRYCCRTQTLTTMRRCHS